MPEPQDAKPLYGYLCLMRPPYHGAIPKDGLERVNFKEGRAPSGHFYWGWVFYSRKLSDEEVEHYDLEHVPNAVLAVKGRVSRNV